MTTTNDAWRRVAAELERRGKTPQWLADRLRFSPQRVHNWQSRGLPASAYVEVAYALGRSVDWVAGAAEPDTHAAMRLFQELPRFDRDEIAEEMRRRVEKYRAYMTEHGPSRGSKR